MSVYVFFKTRPGDLVVLDQFGKQLKKSMLDHFGPCWTLLDHFGPFGTILKILTILKVPNYFG